MDKDIRDSILSNSCAELLTIPICTIKTNYQIGNYNKIFDCVKDIYRNRGFYGFFSASFPSIISRIIVSSSRYTTYNLLERKDNHSSKALHSTLSGVIISLITHPLDNIKVHIQMNNFKFDHLYNGYRWTFIKNCISGPIFIYTYKFNSELFDNMYLSAISTSLINTTLFHPIDYLKTSDIMSVKIKHIFKGLSLNLLREVPYFLIFIVVLSECKKTEKKD